MAKELENTNIPSQKESLKSSISTSTKFMFCTALIISKITIIKKINGLYFYMFFI